MQGTFSLKITKNEEKSHVEMEGVIPKEKIEEVRSQVLERLGNEKKIDGFREGKAPKELVEQSVGALEVWQSSAKEVVMQHFAEILAAEKLTPLGSPHMAFTSIPVGGDVSFTLQFFTMPEVDISGYDEHIQKVSTPEEPKEATDEEIQVVLTDMRRGLFKKENPDKELPKEEKELPELTDAHIQEVSQQYKDMPSFKKGIAESITREKKIQVRTHFRQQILDAIVEKATIQLPDIIIEEESKRAHEEMKGQAESFGTTIEEYLKAQNMTEEQLWKQLREDAEKRSKTQLIINAISAKENVRASKEDIEKEVERLKTRDKNTNEEQLYMYIESLLTNEAVLQFLEKKAQKKEA